MPSTTCIDHSVATPTAAARPGADQRRTGNEAGAATDQGARGGPLLGGVAAGRQGEKARRERGEGDLAHGDAPLDTRLRGENARSRQLAPCRALFRAEGRTMRLTCPLCGERDLREFVYRGSAVLMARPGPEAGATAFLDYLVTRDNPAGPNAELWHHEGGCRAWLRVVRDTRSHAILKTALAREVSR